MGNISNDLLVHPMADRSVRDAIEIAMRGLSEPKVQSTISVVHPAELSSETQQTPGSRSFVRHRSNAWYCLLAMGRHICG
jgi:hypothetical protein